jgi:SAM-dependent methyltransferase
VSEGLSARLDVRAGDRALDVATGSGNTALACARRGCIVTGVDFVYGSLEHARRRAAAEALTMTFVAGDAEQLPFATASFDVVVSTFGAMFAPDQASAAAELLRVCRPGGTIGLATFPPEGFAADLFRLTARSVPPPRGVPPATRWGTEEGIGALFGAGVERIAFTVRSVVFRFRSPEEWLAFFGASFGPVRTALAALRDDQRRRLEEGLLEHVVAYNRSGDQTVVVDVSYAEAILRRSGS